MGRRRCFFGRFWAFSIPLPVHSAAYIVSWPGFWRFLPSRSRALVATYYHYPRYDYIGLLQSAGNFFLFWQKRSRQGNARIHRESWRVTHFCFWIDALIHRYNNSNRVHIILNTILAMRARSSNTRFYVINKQSIRHHTRMVAPVDHYLFNLFSQLCSKKYAKV